MHQVGAVDEGRCIVAEERREINVHLRGVHDRGHGSHWQVFDPTWAGALLFICEPIEAIE